jgi:hypothetical protein
LRESWTFIWQPNVLRYRPRVGPAWTVAASSRPVPGELDVRPGIAVDRAAGRLEMRSNGGIARFDTLDERVYGAGEKASRITAVGRGSRRG